MCGHSPPLMETTKTKKTKKKKLAMEEKKWAKKRAGEMKKAEVK